MEALYAGYVLDWDQKYSFGRPRKVPQQVWFETRAASPEAASYILHKMAHRKGYALGGVKDIQIVRS